MTTLPLQDKRILFFSPAFFSYEKKIVQAMEKMGAVVSFYDERAVTKPLAKAFLKVVPFVFGRMSEKYYRKIIEKNDADGFDYILIVRCDMVTVKTISMLRRRFPGAKMCLHLWDSMRNIKGIKRKIGLFDFVTSFDRHDCSSFPDIRFRPLFFTDDFVSSKTDTKFDLCFCGTIHSDRQFVIDELFGQAERYGLSTYRFAYLQSTFMYYFYKLFGKGFQNATKESFSFQKKSLNEISIIESSSNTVLDVQHPKQMGLTMRVIEMIGAKKKIITTNRDIRNYDFYNPSNILIVDRTNPQLDLSFFKASYEDLPEEIYKKYYIDRWVLDVLGVDS